MKIDAVDEGSTLTPPPPPPSPLAKALDLKAQATSLYQSHQFSPAASLFAECAALGDSDSASDELVAVAAAAWNNAAMCSIKAKEWDYAMSYADCTIQLGKRHSSIPVSTVNKAHFRTADAMVSKVERVAANDESVDCAFLLDEAQKHLMFVLQEEPSNEQALAVAQRGLSVSAVIVKRNEETGGGYLNEEVVGGSEKGRSDQDVVAAALGGGNSSGSNSGNSGWGMSYMNPAASDWETYQKGQAEAAKSAASILEATRGIAAELTSPTTCDVADGRGGLSAMVESLKKEKQSATPQPAFSNEKVTSQDWSNMKAVETSLNASFTNILQQRDAVVGGLRTGESNYSDGWRSKHAARRYEGKEDRGKVAKGGDAWADLEKSEAEKVKIVSEVEKKKKEQREGMGGMGGKKREEKKEDGEEAGGWRDKLRTRRQGEEIKIKVKSDGKVKSEWENLLGAEEGEVARVERLRAERKKAEKLADKRKKKTEAKNGKIMKDLLG